MAKHYMYGKSHQVKSPYVMQVFAICDEYLAKIKDISSDYRINNLVVALRNDVSRLIDEIYQQLSIELRHNMVITPTRRTTLELARPIEQGVCAICGEQRVVNRCHIIPREHSGSNAEDNMLYLCPTHHFLLDQARLSEEELSKLTITEKAKDSIEYFERIHKVRHQMNWRYGLNKSEGCDCGSLEFDYDAIQNGNYIMPGLVCKNCGMRWFLGEGHPLIKELSVQLYDLFEIVDEQEKQRRLNTAIEKVRQALAERFAT